MKQTLWLWTALALGIKTAFVRSIILTEGHLSGWLLEVALLVLALVVLSRFRRPGLWLTGFNFLYSCILLMTALYFDYYNAILTYQTLSQAGQVKDVLSQAAALLKPEYAIFFADFLLLPLLVKKTSALTVRRPGWRLLLAGTVLLTAFSIRQARETVSEIHQYDELGLIGFQLWTAAGGMMDALKPPQSVSPKTVARMRPSVQEQDRVLTGSGQGMNLILIQLESVQSFLLGREIAGKELTPTLNRLVEEGFYFPHFYSQVGKGNTSDAEFIANTSVYPLGDVPMSTAVKAVRFSGLPSRLREEGYVAATFHANDVSFWNRQDLYRSLQFSQVYDKAFFGTNDPISYGASDEVLYKKTLKKLSDFSRGGQPFYAHIISLSSHFPYNLPETKTKLLPALPTAFRGTSTGSYIQAVRYADYALGQLIDGLKEEDLYDRSVIALYGDHQGLQIKNSEDSALVRGLIGHEYDMLLDHLNVPLIIRVPGVQGRTVEQAGGTVDLYPTLANLLGIPLEEEIVFGTDLLNSRRNAIGFRFYAPNGTYLTEEFSFTPGASKDSGQLTSLAVRSRKPADARSLREFETVLEYLKLSDAYVKSMVKDGDS